MTKITNVSGAGPRGVETADHGTVYIEPGETVDVNLADEKAPLYEGLEAGDAAAKKVAKAAKEEPEAKAE
jgi:hypothetical protein